MYDAIVLAGGGGRRLGGVDKAALDVGGSTLLDRVLAAVADAGRVVVVGPPRPLPEGVGQTREQPPGGGPVAALAAGLASVDAPLVAVLACDLPFVTGATVEALLRALAGDHEGASDGAWLVDGERRPQSLTAVYRTERLRAATASLPGLHGTPMRDIVSGLRMLEVDAAPGQAWDCDTWADVRRARERVGTDPLEEA